MATITSVLNFVGTKSWNDTTAWQGGVVPTSADTANIFGVRTTINQTAFSAWTGVRTITVASTTNFPSSGVFYTVTECNLKVRVNYTATTATQFLGCSLDTSYANWQLLSLPHPFGGVINNGTFVHFSPVIQVSGITVNAGIIVISNGGYLKITSGATFSIQDGVTVNDGTFEVSGTADILWELNNTNATTGTASRIQSTNSVLSRILIEGDENRTNTTLTASTVVGQGYLDVANSNGFEIGDEIIISDPNIQLYRVDNNFRSTGNAFYEISGTTDEMVSVAGKSGNRIFIEKKNGINAPILDVQSTTQIVVDSTRFNVGDIITVNNDVFTIQTVEDYDFIIADENFSGGTTTNLNNWETSTTRSPYFDNFTYVANNNGFKTVVQSGSTSYRQLFLKNIYRDEVKVEAIMSNNLNVTGGTQSGGGFGVVINADPSMDYDYAYSSFARSHLEFHPNQTWFRCVARNCSSDINNIISAAGLTNYGIKKFTLESRKGLLKSYINDVLYIETYQRAGLYNGRVGIFTNGMNAFNLLRFTVYATGQRLTLNKPGTFTSGMTVSESGLDYVHNPGNLVIKNASILSNFDKNIPISFAYIGSPSFENTGIYPYIYNVTTGALPVGTTTRNTNSNNFSIAACNMTYDLGYYLNFGSNSGSCVYDLVSAQTFSHISFREYPYGNTMTITSPIKIDVSNDLTNWTQVYFAATDTVRRQGLDSLRMYNIGVQTARYVRIFRGGGTSSNTNNFISNFAVHDYSQGFTFTLNNASDYNVGDRLMVLYNGGFQPDVSETDFYTNLLSGTVPASAYTSNLQGYYTVLSKTGNTVTIDRPFTHGYLTGGEKVIKLNRSIRFRGGRGTNLWKSGRWVVDVGGFTAGRLIIVRNVEFTHMSYNYPSGQASVSINAFGVRGPYSTFDSSIYDRISFYDSMPAVSSNNIQFLNLNNAIFRNCNFIGWNGLVAIVYYPVFGSSAFYHVGNNYAIFMPSSSGIRAEASSNILVWFMYNNVYAGASTYGFYPFTQLSTSFYTRPNITFIKRNIINGGQSTGLLFFNRGNFGLQNWNEVDGNLIEYQDDNIMDARGYSPYPIKNQLLSKTQSTVNRTSRFNNNSGFFSSQCEQPNTNFRNQSTNFNRWGYDLQVFNFGYILKYPNEEFWRFYKFDRTLQNPMVGLTVGINNPSTTVSVEVGIEYLNDRSTQYQNSTENTYSAACAFYTLKDNSLFSPITILPKSLTKTAYTYNISFTGTGYYSVGFSQVATTGYVGIYSMYSKITSNNPSDVYVVTNNFDTLQLGSTYPRDYTQFNTQRNNASVRLQGSRLY